MAAFPAIHPGSRTRLIPAIGLFLFAALASPAAADQVALKADTQKFFKARVAPFLETYCIACHQNKTPTRGGVNFSPAIKDPGHPGFSEQWKKAGARVAAHDMPPKGMPQPSDADREMFGEWLTKLKYLSVKDPGPFVIRRLTKTEYGNTLHDLTGVDPSIVDGLPDEVSGEGYMNSLSPIQLEQYLKIADKVVTQITSQKGPAANAIRLRLFGKPPSSRMPPRDAAREVARALAKQAYRRPPTPAEIDVLLAAFDLGKSKNLSYQQSLELVLKAALISPQFLFITPAETGTASGIIPLDDYQLASRLSYLLWSTMPDAPLMALADNGTLHQPAVLEAQTLRLLKDPRSRALFDGFGAQWLGVGNIKRQVFDPALFPQMTPQLRTAMYDEARLYFESIVRENKSIIRFVDGDYTYLNGTLAPFYGLEKSVTGPAMRRVSLADANRGGVLAMPGVLAANSLPTRTSAVKRGVWVLEQVLGQHVPSPPPNVPPLGQQDPSAIQSLTLRQRTELHRTNPVCANCHKVLDPIGFGLENFDAIGRWRDRDSNSKPIDAAGELPGGEHFSSPKDLKAIIAKRTDALSRNMVEKLLGYTLGRRLEGYDEIVVDNLVQDVAADGYRMQTLIKSVVTSYPFMNRRIGRKEDLR